MKFNKIFLICKVILFAVMLFSLDIHCSSASKRALAKFKKNQARFRSKIIEINASNVKESAYGIIMGFVNQKISKMIDLKNLIKEGATITKATFSNVSKNCLDTANVNFEKTKDVAKEGNEHFNTFVNVIDSDHRDRVMEKFIKACEDNDKDLIAEYTQKQINRLNSKVKEGAKTAQETKDNAKKLLSDITNENSWFGSFKTQSICPYLQKSETWTSLIQRWTTYSSDIFGCYSNSLADSLFKNPAVYKLLLYKLFTKGLKAFYGFNPIKLAKIVLRAIGGLYNGNSGYFEAGRILGEAIGENFSITGISGLKRRRRY